MRRWILPGGPMFVIALIATLAIALQAFVYNEISSLYVVSSGKAQLVSVSNKSDDIRATVLYKGKKQSVGVSDSTLYKLLDQKPKTVLYEEYRSGGARIRVP